MKMEVEMTRISEKGQVVIPSSLRQEMGIETSDQFLVFGEGNTIILKRIEKPVLQKSLSTLLKPLQKIVSEVGFTKKDFNKTIKEIKNKF